MDSSRDFDLRLVSFHQTRGEFDTPVGTALLQVPGCLANDFLPLQIKRFMNRVEYGPQLPPDRNVNYPSSLFSASLPNHCP